MRAAGAGETCWVISSCSEIDNQEQPLLESLRNLFCTGYDSILLCIPGHLALWRTRKEGGSRRSNAEIEEPTANSGYCCYQF